MKDHEGIEWLLATEAARWVNVEPVTVRSWVVRGKVRAHRLRGRLWVAMPDVWDAEHATRGRFVDQRRRRMQH